MNISIIAGSHRENSESKRVAKIIETKSSSKSIKSSVIDLGNEKLPMWSDDKKQMGGVWNNISECLQSSSGFIFIVPEYGGMATPQVKNFFLLCNKGELSHKPGLIVSVSSGTGGAYPISELRASSYKNTHIMWIPENIIIRNVQQFLPGNHGQDIPVWVEKRLDYCLKLLLAYSQQMIPLRKLINRKDFGNGM